MIQIYESLDLVKDKTQDNIWLLNIRDNEKIPDNIHYDEVVSASLYSLAVKLPALLTVIQKWVKETTGKAWDWDYIVYVKNREELKLTNSNGYVVPYNKIKSL